MLSFNDIGFGGVLVARVDGGKFNNKPLFMYSNEEIKEYENNEFNDNNDYDEIYNIIKPNKKGSNNLSMYEINLLKQYIISNTLPEDDKLKKIYGPTKKKLKNKFETEINIHDSGKFIPLPNINNERCIWSLYGASGSGKSYLAGLIIREYKKIYPDNKIYIFSRVNSDMAYDSIDDIIRVDIDEDLINNKKELLNNFENCLCVFDDIDVLPSIEMQKEIKNYTKKNNEEEFKETSRLKNITVNLATEMIKLRDDILETGRHKNISAVCMSHQILNYGKTSKMRLESHYEIIYPNSGGSYWIKSYMSKYLGIDKKMQEKILKMPSRWVLISTKTFPMYVLSENQCFLLNN